jgi:hypothetical protein
MMFGIIVAYDKIAVKKTGARLARASQYQESGKNPQPSRRRARTASATTDVTKGSKGMA